MIFCPVCARIFPSTSSSTAPVQCWYCHFSGARGEIGRRVTVASNGSAEAVRAITSAIPVPKRAEEDRLRRVRRRRGRESAMAKILALIWRYIWRGTASVSKSPPRRLQERRGILAVVRR